MMKRLFLLPILLLFTFFNAQEYIMQDGTVTTCSGTFYDSGGASGRYSSNENFVYTICPDRSTDPELATVLDFYYLRTSTNNDILYIYDGDDTTAPLIATLSGGTGAIVRASDIGTSPTGCLTVQFISDGGGEGQGWEATISCEVPCQKIEPTVTTIPAMNTEGNVEILETETVEFSSSTTFSQDGTGATYLWDFGDGESASGESAIHAYPTAGTYTVSLTVTDSDGCSEVYTFLVIVSYNINVPCPGVNPRDVQTETTDDLTIDCNYELESDGGIRLEANFTEIRGTESYEVISIPYQPPYDFVGLTNEIGVNIDDCWGPYDVFPSDFSFCFFGEQQTHYQVGANGNLSFNNNGPADVRGSCTWGLPDDALVPTPTIHTNSIMLYHDIDPEHEVNDRAEMGYEILGAPPCRALVVAYSQVPHYQAGGDSGADTTFMMVLYEASNIIDFYVQDKPMGQETFTNAGRAVLGIQNETGTQGYTPPGRNTGLWSAQNEAWRFQPNGAPLSVTIVWEDENENELGRGDEYIAYPNGEDTTYTVKVTYEICGQAPITVQDTINITFDLDEPEVDDFSIPLCDTDGDGVVTWDIETPARERVSAINPDWVIQGVYTELRGAGEADPAYLIADPTAYDSGERTVYIRVESPNGCFSIVEVPLDISDGLEIDPLSETLCIEPDSTEITIDLSEYSQQIPSNQIIDVYYYTVQADSETGEANYLQGTDLTEFTISSSTIVYIRVVSEDGCYGLSQLDIEVNEAPFRYIFDDPVQFCDTDPTGEENVDLTGYEDDIANGETGVTFLYFENYQDALDNDASAAITDPTQYTLTASVTELYILVQDEDGCYKVITMPISLLDGLDLQEQTIPLCDVDNDNSEEWDLTSVSEDIIVNSTDYTFTYYPSQQDLDGGTNEITTPATFLSGETTVYVLVSNTDGCSSITTITLELNDVPVVNLAELSVCPDENGDLIFDLTEAESDLLNGQTGITLTYHNTQADAVQGENPITDFTNYTGTDGEIVYVNMVLGDCSAVSQITLNASDVPTATQPDNIIVCDADASGNEEVDLTSREAAIIGTQTDLTITYHTSQEEANTGDNTEPTPTTYLANVGTTTIYVRVENDSECYATTMFDVIVNSGPTLTPQSIILCDEGGDGSEAFDLTSMNDQISGGVTGHMYAYYESVNDINIGNSITSDVTNYSSTGQIIYVVVNDGNDCPSYTELELIVKALPVVTDNTLPICDPDFDGEYGFTLTDLYGLVVTNTNDYSFDVYTSLVDAQNMDNPMSQADAENITTVPFNVYVRVTEVSGEPLCSNIAMVELTQGDQTQVNTTFDTVYACDEGNGMATFDFSNLSVTTETTDTEISFHATMEDAENNNAPLTADSALLGTRTIFVRVTAEGKCPSITQFDVEVIAKPIAEITSSNFSLCVDNTITLTASNYNSAYQYVWTNQDETVLGNGETVDIVGANGDQEITLTVTNAAASTSCQSTATQEIDVISTATIVDLDVSGTTVTVTATGQGPFEYSYDGINWQTSNVLTVPEDGYYDIYVRSYNLGCTGVGSSTLVLDINNVITPNGDGVNDVFVIPFMDVFKDENNNVQPSTFNIYDRFGKLIHSDVSSEAKVQFIWNGLFEGRIIPSGDYWYLLKLADGRQLTGHITVKNR